MEIRYERLVRSHLTPIDTEDLQVVDRLAAQLRRHLDECAELIDRVHVHDAKSSAVQAIVATLLSDHLDFGQEVRLSPSFGFETRARPDFYYRLADGRGVLAEVERGGTTTNNHDLKDVWKAHIAPDAQHLFLIVPNSNWTKAGKARERPFPLVARRLRSFFGDPRREVDIVSIHLYGYGRLVLPSTEPSGRR